MLKPQKKNLKKPSNRNPGESEVLPPNDGEDRRGKVLSHTRITQTWNAPFLPPEIMKKYDDVVPDGAARLFKIFEDETKHRREMDSTALGYQGRDLLVGKILALVFVLAVLGVIMFAVQNNSPWVAAVLGAGMLGTIAIGFFRVFGDGASKKPKEETLPQNKIEN
jgi:uncharacterized membrane protein